MTRFWSRGEVEKRNVGRNLLHTIHEEKEYRQKITTHKREVEKKDWNQKHGMTSLAKILECW